MKKVVFILLVAVTFAACKGDDGRNGLDGISSSWYNNSYTVTSGNWELAGNPNELNSHYYADIQIPQLTEEVFDYGAVIVYLETGNDVKNVMPYVLHKGQATGWEPKLWTQTYDYQIEPGWIRLYVTFSDFKTDLTPDTEKFHVVMMW